MLSLFFSNAEKCLFAFFSPPPSKGEKKKKAHVWLEEERNREREEMTGEVWRREKGWVIQMSALDMLRV